MKIERTPRSAPVLTVSVAAELAGMHPQTVRQYDRLGLVVASRTRGGGRRYSLDDVTKLQEIQRLSQDGVSLPGIARIFELEREVEALQRTVAKLQRSNAKLEGALETLQASNQVRRARDQRIFAASPEGDVMMASGMEELLREVLREHQQRTTSTSTEIVIWRPALR